MLGSGVEEVVLKDDFGGRVPLTRRQWSDQVSRVRVSDLG